MFLINPYILQASGGAFPYTGIQAYYTADNTANDATGNGYNGTLVNGATYGTGKINQGFSLDGINDYVSLNSSLQMYSGVQAHSYSAWCYSTDATIDLLDVIINNGTVNTGTMLAIRNGYPVFYYSGGNAYFDSNVLLSINTWNHIVATYNGSGSVNIYINGVLGNSGTISTSWAATGTNDPRIGSWVGNQHFFQGIIDEVGIWNRELTASEVTELYNSGAGKQY